MPAASASSPGPHGGSRLRLDRPVPHMGWNQIRRHARYSAARRRSRTTPTATSCTATRCRSGASTAATAHYGRRLCGRGTAAQFSRRAIPPGALGRNRGPDPSQFPDALLSRWKSFPPSICSAAVACGSTRATSARSPSTTRTRSSSLTATGSWRQATARRGPRRRQDRHRPRISTIIRKLASGPARGASRSGGGVRSRDMVDALLAAGAKRVVVGSVAINDPPHGDRLARGRRRRTIRAGVRRDSSIPASGEPLAVTHGWRDTSGKRLWDLMEQFLACRRAPFPLHGRRPRRHVGRP